MEISLFLGAGMSTNYGMPTTTQFRSLMLSKYLQQAAWRRLLEDTDLPGMEDVWAAVESYNNLAATPGSGYLIQKLEGAGVERREMATLQVVLEHELFNACRWQARNNHLLDGVLRPILSLAHSPSGNVRVFTTNCDRSVEEYCSDPSRGFQCYDGFEYDSQTGRTWWAGFAGGPAPPDGGAWTESSILSLLKIHGSLGWKFSKQYGLERMTYEAKSADPNYDDILIYPTGLSKSAYGGIHGDVFGEFAGGLSASDACVVVGYSFSDELIAGQFARFVEGGRTLVAVGPEAAASLNNVLRLAAVGGGPAGWAQVGESHFAYAGGSSARIHAIQEPVQPETVHNTVAAVRNAIAMRGGLVQAPARGSVPGRGEF